MADEKKISKNIKPKKPLTRYQRILRGPLFWILAAIIGVTIFGQISSAGNQYTQVSTSQILDAISKSQVDSVVLVDKDQKIVVIGKYKVFS